MKSFIYYLFNKKEKSNCQCDIDCQCVFNEYKREQRKIKEWFSFKGIK